MQTFGRRPDICNKESRKSFVKDSEMTTSHSPNYGFDGNVKSKSHWWQSVSLFSFSTLFHLRNSQNGNILRLRTDTL